jgi:hypothetical protein
MTQLTWLILAGAVVGLGLALMVSQLRAAPPDLGAVLERMQPRGPLGRPAAGAGLLDRIGLPLVTMRGVRLPEQELALTGRTPSRFMATKVLCALLGLAVPPYLQLFTLLLGIHVTLLLSLGGALALAGVLWFLPDWSLKGQAEEARTEYLHAISAYLELVAMERAAATRPGRGRPRSGSSRRPWRTRPWTGSRPGSASARWASGSA